MAVNVNEDVVDVVIVGAGFAGIYTAIHATKEALSVVGIDAASDVGGTWFWNRYPGARCDVESIDYSFSFDEELQQQWRWTERYATQPEILGYLNHVADRYNVRDHYRFGERLTEAVWNESSHVWQVTTENGLTLLCRWLVMASGSLSQPVLPPIRGLDSFDGEILMTAAWPEKDPDLRGKKIGLIGTGSSGIQALPHLADEAEAIVVYQRTANYSIPAFHWELDGQQWQEAQANYGERRRVSWNSLAGSPWTSHPTPFHDASKEERESVFEDFWTKGGVLFAKAFSGLTADPDINAAATDFFLKKLANIVDDPQTLVDLTPKDQPLGAKRICTDSGYYECFNRKNVELVNLPSDPIVSIGPDGVTTQSGFHQHDVLVFATGFDALTGALTAPTIRGRGNRLLRAQWQDGVTTFLGMGIPGFPNLLSLNGPGSPTVLSNMALTSEQQGRFALDLIHYCDRHGFSSAEARADTAAEWTEDNANRANSTFFGSASSWYTGANIEGKAREFLPFIGGFRPYIEACDSVSETGYAGFLLSNTSANRVRTDPHGSGQVPPRKENY